MGRGAYVVQQKIREFLKSRQDQSDFDPFVRHLSVQLLLEAAVSVLVRSTASKQQSGKLDDEIGICFLSLSAEVAMERVIKRIF